MTDLLARPATAFFWWCVPLLAGFSAQFLVSGPRAVSLVWAISLAWMGTGCVLNAVHCSRLHCYIAAPLLLSGALAEALMAANLVALGRHGETNVAGTALLLALLSFVPEMVWGRYARR